MERSYFVSRDGLIQRNQFDEVPQRVEYSLSALGESLSPVFDEMAAWGRKYLAAGLAEKRNAGGECTGRSGAGKTTLIRLMLCELQASSGFITNVAERVIYIDQDYSLINDDLA